jgi:hypothetical protein
MRTSGVQHLLMGGQACVFYGAAEFSRDTDLAVLAQAENLARLRNALAELQAECIAVSPFEQQYLERGLAVHFRCRRPDVAGMRVDVMSRMRGLADFQGLWDRRTTLEIQGEAYDLLSLPDLVQTKKTQREKDWPMIARLVEANYFANRDEPSPAQVDFWLRELRTPELLIEAACRFPARLAAAFPDRDLLIHAQAGEPAALAGALRDEAEREKAADRAYWDRFAPNWSNCVWRGASRSIDARFHAAALSTNRPDWCNCQPLGICAALSQSKG